MALKLELGKRYRRRDGLITNPLTENTNLNKAWSYIFWDNKFNNSYMPDGAAVGAVSPQPEDLVERYITTKVPKASSIQSECGCKQLQTLDEVHGELQHAMATFPPFNTAHEGYAILLEEVEELWAEIKKKQGSEGRPEAIRKEAVQVAAMALRLILDTTDPSKKAYNK